MKDQELCSKFVIRSATAEDAPALRQLIQELAEHQETPDGPEISAKQLASDLTNERAHAFIIYHRRGGGGVDATEADEPAAMTMYYYAYSTWQGQFIHMEDLVVRQKYRRRGLARKLVNELVNLSVANGMKRMEWTCLKWNDGARSFYDTLGASDMTEKEGWLIYRIDEQQLKQLHT